MKSFKILFLFFYLFSLNKMPVSTESIWARSYVIIEQTRGEVLEGKDIYLSRSVASISKIMTAIVAIESESLFQIVKVGDEIDEVVGSSLYLEKGTEIRIIDLVYGLLLRSGNDAAMIIAKNVGGEVEKFVDRMNQKGKEIGMNHTTFHNPHGLDINEEGNISCAYDMALLMRYCLDNELFQEITGTKRYHCPNIGIWENKHKLLQKYEYCIGGKTGFTSKAKRTLVSAAKKDGLQLICVTLDCGGDFSFHRQLFESYFQRFEGLPLLEKGNNYINDYVFYTRKSYTVFIPKEKAHHLLIIYALDVDRKTITFRIVYQDATEDVYGPFSIESFQKIK